MKVILVTGSPGGATQYISKALTECFKLDIPHEKWGRDGMVHWYCKNMGLRPGASEVKVLHQTREPLANISSLMLHPEVYHPVYYKRGRIAEMAYWYVDWHRGIERWAENFNQYYRYRVEDFSRDLKEISTFINEECSLEIQEQVDQIPTNINAHRKASDKLITWEELRGLDQVAYRRVKELGKEYGY